jgi:hypothetical protein
LPTVAKPKLTIKEQPPVTLDLSFNDQVRSLVKSPTATQTGIIELLIKELVEKHQLFRPVLMVLSKDGTLLLTRMSNHLDSQSPLLKLKIKASQSLSHYG